MGSREWARAAGFTELIHRRTSGGAELTEDHSGSPATADRVAVIACYDNDGAAPRVETVEFSNPATFIDVVSLAAMNCVAANRGTLSDEIIFELVSNLVHADFTDPVISVLDGGNTIRVTDAGPGIPDKDSALRPGFTSASLEQKQYIRGAGAGLPLVKQLVESSGGFLIVDDNIGGGTVITASAIPDTPHRYSPSTAVASPGTSRRLGGALQESVPAPHKAGVSTPPDGPSSASGAATQPNSIVTTSSSTVRGVPLSERQREVLAVVADSVEAGPSTVSTLLSIPLSTAYRDLRLLEDRGLVSSLDGGKRQVTGMGIELLRLR